MGFGSSFGITDLSSNSFQALVRIGVIYVEYIPLYSNVYANFRDANGDSFAGV
jgi:hypothetical protein